MGCKMSNIVCIFHNRRLGDSDRYQNHMTAWLNGNQKIIICDLLYNFMSAMENTLSGAPGG